MIRKAKIQEVPEIRRFLGEFPRMGASCPGPWPISTASCGIILSTGRTRAPSSASPPCTSAGPTWGKSAPWPCCRTHRGRGIGSRLVQTCLAEARALGLSEIFLLTLVPEFFQRFGFRVVSREDLLPIVWADCVNCVKFPDCDEIPMLLDLTAPDPGD